jgi:hypothetical protein
VHRLRRLWLSVIAYSLGNLWRRLVLPKGIGTRSLTSLQQRLVKAGGRLVTHARYYWLMLAEGHLTRGRFAAMLRRIACYRFRRTKRPAAKPGIRITEGKGGRIGVGAIDLDGPR